MKRKTLIAVISSIILAAPLFAGALTLEVADPQTNIEAQGKHAVVLARVTACNSPDKTVVAATAEGIVNGKRRSMPLTVVKLGTPGLYAVTKEWPSEGVWSVRFVATNPEYRNYATGAIAPVHNDTYLAAGAKQFFHAPSEDEIKSTLKRATLE